MFKERESKRVERTTNPYLCLKKKKSLPQSQCNLMQVKAARNLYQVKAAAFEELHSKVLHKRSSGPIN